MNKKGGIFIVVLVIAVAIYWFLGQKPEVPQQQAQQQEQTQMPPGHGQMMAVDLPDWEQVTIDIEVAPGQIIEGVVLTPSKAGRLEGTDLSLRATDFYTHWNWDQKAINLSKQEANPAVKVEVIKDGKILYYGWAFKQMPFFRMSSHKGEGGDEELAFTLMDYQGLRWPAEMMEGE